MSKARLIRYFLSETEKYNSMGHSFMLFSSVKSCTGSGKGTTQYNKSRERIEIIGEAMAQGEPGVEISHCSAILDITVT